MAKLASAVNSTAVPLPYLCSVTEGSPWRNLSTTYASPDVRFLSALTGGFLLGWGVMIWCLSIWVYDHAPEAVRKAVITGVLCWFFLDSAGFVASGNESNVFFNVLVLLLAVGPLWRPAQTEEY